MSRTTERLTALQEAVATSLQELGEDAENYLEGLKKLETLPNESDGYQEAMTEMHVIVASLMAHATSANDLLHEVDDATPDDDE